jgi:hypothetical protein
MQAAESRTEPGRGGTCKGHLVRPANLSLMLLAARNTAIVLALAALVVLVPGGGSGASFALQAVSLLFLGVIGWFGYVSYRDHRLGIYTLGSRRRAVLYGSIGLVVLTLTATSRLFETTAGRIVWLLLLVAAAYATFAVVWSARKYR